MVAQERRERATVKERTSISDAKSQTVVENQDGLESRHEEIGKIQVVHRNQSAQECGMDTQREWKGEYVRYDRTGEAPGATDSSSDDDDVIGVASGSDEDNATVVATLDAEILSVKADLEKDVKCPQSEN